MINISQHCFVPTNFTENVVFSPAGSSESTTFNSAGISYCDGSNACFIAAPISGGYMRVYKSNWPSSQSGVWLDNSFAATSHLLSNLVLRFVNDNSDCLMSCRQYHFVPLDVRFLFYRDNSPMPVSLGLRNSFTSDVINDEEEVK